tara:strand:+ start:99 stop:761 length:663 start_codon:yes stop_codon:yes gene_type:complete
MGAPIKNFKKENYTDEFIKELYNKDWHNYHYDVFRQKNKNFGKILLEMYNWNSIIDFGCSVGSILEVFLEEKKVIKGYEYCYENCLESIKKIPNLEYYIEYGDVTKYLANKTYDASISIEVAEHIPTEYSEMLVKNLVNSTNNIIIFTAATPDQGGTGHINCQEKEFWIDLFEKNNCYYDKNETTNIKNKCIPTKKVENEDYPYIWEHVYKNLMVFKKLK